MWILRRDEEMQERRRLSCLICNLKVIEMWWQIKLWEDGERTPPLTAKEHHLVWRKTINRVLAYYTISKAGL